MQAQIHMQNVAQQARQPPVEQQLELKLPTLRLPEFKGDCEEWLLFKDAYKAMIHQNAKLTAIQKFQYIRTIFRVSS